MLVRCPLVHSWGVRQDQFPTWLDVVGVRDDPLVEMPDCWPGRCIPQLCLSNPAKGVSLLDRDGPNFRHLRRGSDLVELLSIDRATGASVPGGHGHCGSRKSESLTDDEMINVDIGVGSDDASPRSAIPIPGLGECPQVVMRANCDSHDVLVVPRVAVHLSLRRRLRGSRRSSH